MTQLILDVVDLLQLQEIWSWRPIVVAFSRLERREPQPQVGTLRFELTELMPRLSRLRQSPDWQTAHHNQDPARLPLRDLSDTELNDLYPEIAPDGLRQSLFLAAYQCFVVARHRGADQPTRALLRALADVRQLEADDHLDVYAFPRQGSPDWIPADITDEIRGLDSRYRGAEAGTPAAYVIADSFWSLLLKAEANELDSAARLASSTTPVEVCRRQLASLLAVAQLWNRSPSVVGLCYQVQLEET